MKLERVSLPNSNFFFVVHDSNNIVIFENKNIPYTGNSEEYIKSLSAYDLSSKKVFIDQLVGSDISCYRILKLNEKSAVELEFLTLPKKIKSMINMFYNEGVDFKYPKFLEKTFSKKRNNILSFALSS